MSGTLAYLQPDEEAAVSEYLTRLIDRLNGRLVGMHLFGSKARGDFMPDSDLDLLIILKNDDWKTKDTVRFIAADVSLEYDVLINTHILSQARWEKMARQQATLWQEVRRDGVPLMSDR